MYWLKEFIDYKELSILSFEKSVGTRSAIDKAIKNKSNLRSDLLAKIIDVYPEINPNWLLTGKGNMLLDKPSSKLKEIDKIELLNLLIDKNDELLRDDSFRKYFKMNMELLLFDEEKEKAKEAIEKLRTYQKLKNKSNS